MSSTNPGLNYLATKPDVHIPGSTSPKYDVDYDFLSDSPLSRNFDYCVPDSASSLTVFLCIYHINASCQIVAANDSDVPSLIRAPFVEYLCTVDPAAATFPSFAYNCDDTSSDTNETLFKQECTLHLLSALSLPSETPSDDAFKGMVFSQKHKCLLVVYDLSLLVPKIDRAKHTFALVDELVFAKKVWDAPVLPAISDTMRDTPALWTITYADGMTDFPFALYLVEANERGVYDNDHLPASFDPEDAEQHSLYHVGHVLDDYKYGEMYGEMHLFTAKPLSTDRPVQKYRRYALFVSGAKYLLEDRYHHDYIASRPPIHAKESLYEPATEPDDDADMDTSAISVIYFVEDTKTTHPIQMWGARHTYQFTEL